MRWAKIANIASAILLVQASGNSAASMLTFTRSDGVKTNRGAEALLYLNRNVPFLARKKCPLNLTPGG